MNLAGEAGKTGLANLIVCHDTRRPCDFGFSVFTARNQRNSTIKAKSEANKSK